MKRPELIDEPPLDKQFAQAYQQLLAIAHFHIDRLPIGATLTPTSLLHEAYLKIRASAQVDPNNMESWDGLHFINIAALAMRQLVVDHVRRRVAKKRGGNYERVSLDEERVVHLPIDQQLLDLDEAISELSKENELAARVVVLRYFGGAKWDEIAETLKLSSPKVRRIWGFAKAWLYDRLTKDGPTNDS